MGDSDRERQRKWGKNLVKTPFIRNFLIFNFFLKTLLLGKDIHTVKLKSPNLFYFIFNGIINNCHRYFKKRKNSPK